MELKRETHFNLDITSETEILTYTYTGSDLREVIARVDLGTDSKPIAGNGMYSVKFYIDDVLITPNNDIVVPAGVTKTIIISRAVPIEVDDVVSVSVVGLGGDTSVDTVVSLRDVTPIKVEDVTGDGSVVIDQDYESTDALSYKTAEGVGIASATILVYLTSDYILNNRSNAFVIAKTTTVTGGKWAFALKLDPEDYTLIYYRTGAYGPDRRDITVA